MSELRLVLDVTVSPGHQMSAKHALPGLESVLDRITPRDQPRLVRGDCGFGNEATLVVCESREIDYLFRLRQSSNVKKLIARLHTQPAGHPPTVAMKPTSQRSSSSAGQKSGASWCCADASATKTA